MHRNTKQKRAILNVLEGTKSHPTADWIYHEVRKKMPNISLGTVYRNLRIMADEGEITEVDMSGEHSRFDARRGNHYHFRCQRCDAVCDVEEPVHQELDRKVAMMTRLIVSHHVLEFRGTCSNCKG